VVMISCFFSSSSNPGLGGGTMLLMEGDRL
jgi:hypothetical protein